jgi:hypothetical protein
MPDAPGSSFSTYSAVLPKTMGPSWSLGGHDSCHVSPNGIWVCEVGSCHRPVEILETMKLMRSLWNSFSTQGKMKWILKSSIVLHF